MTKVSRETVDKLNGLRYALSSGQDVGYIVDQIIVLLLDKERRRPKPPRGAGR